MNRRTIAPTLAGLAAVVAIASACATATPVPTTAVPQASGAPKPAASTTSTPVPTSGTVGAIGELLVLRMAQPTSNDAYTVMASGQGRILFNIADGVVSDDWRTLASLTADGDSTRVQISEPEGGGLPTRISVPGAWRLPTVGVARQRVGLSADGSVLVLEEATIPAQPSPTATTRFAIVATTGANAARVITLKGSFVFDVLSPDGRWLYLLEYLGDGDPTHYQVRRLDVAGGRLVDGPIVDKRTIGERMTGFALTQAVGRDGWVFTLYRGPRGAFVHALDTSQGIAFCIDLPGTDDESPDMNGDWGLVADPSGSFLYVTDPAERRVSAIDLAGFTVARSANLASIPSVRFAKLETLRTVGGGRVALSADGATLFVVGPTGVGVVRVADLVTIGHLGGTGVYRSLAVGSAGTVYAVDDAGRVVRLGPDGATPVGNGTYASIVGLVPLR